MRLVSLLSTASIVIVIILSNLLFLTFNYNNYIYLLEKNNIYINFQKQQVNQKVNDLIDYFRGKNNLEDNFFSTQAKIHLKDVKSLINIAFAITIISVVYLICVEIFLSKMRKISLLMKSVQDAALITPLIAFLFAIFSLSNFDFVFVKFHELLFRNNYWLFDSSDNIVKLFTDKFFTSFATQLFTNITITSLALILFAKLQLKK